MMWREVITFWTQIAIRFCFIFFRNNASLAKTNSMSRARKISTSSFPRSKIFKNRLGDSHRPWSRHHLCLFCRVHNKQSVEGETVRSGSGNKRQDREGNNIFSMYKISFNLALGVFLWLNASCSYIQRCMYIMSLDKNYECHYLSKEYNLKLLRHFPYAHKWHINISFFNTLSAIYIDLK